MPCVYPFQPHAKCCSFWICFMGCLGGVQWVGLTHISQVFLHTIKSVPVQLWANKMRWNVISVEQGKLRWLQTVAAALPLVWMALDLIEVFRCLTEHWANFFLQIWAENTQLLRRNPQIWYLCQFIFGLNNTKSERTFEHMKQFRRSLLKCGDVKMVTSAMLHRCSAMSTYLSTKAVYFVHSLCPVTNGRSIDHRDTFKWNFVKDRNIS